MAPKSGIPAGPGTSNFTQIPDFQVDASGNRGTKGLARELVGSLGGAWVEPPGSLRVASGWLPGGYQIASRWLRGGFTGAVTPFCGRDRVRPSGVPPYFAFIATHLRHAGLSLPKSFPAAFFNCSRATSPMVLEALGHCLAHRSVKGRSVFTSRRSAKG
jgi:hypothetical protein